MRLPPIIMLTALLACVACQPPVVFTERDKEEASRVVVVVNQGSTDSEEVAGYYRTKRAVPAENVIKVKTVTTDNIPYDDYYKSIEKPVKEAIGKLGRRIDYIVMTKGVPIRINDDGGAATDALLAGMNLPFGTISQLTEEGVKKSMNPYFGSEEPFESTKFRGMYLVTRLDGPTVADAKRLIDNALAAKSARGPFFFDQAGNRNSEGYSVLNKALEKACEDLRSGGWQAALESTNAFVAPSEALMGYCSWGSNDSGFSEVTYHKLKFLPGALAETFVSTSGRSFEPGKPGQSQITDLIKQGVTGVKGYVSEPYTFALARPEILFQRYTKGMNLAESFYAASLVAKWKDVVIGDPLCRPYRKD
ncbi:MAG: TIGR03790 family protein [Armatimonadetes bacterium]|nr:TIGR03790 family protein [Armatimonadota bacterium]